MCSWGTLKVKVKSLGCVQLFATPWTLAYQASPSMGFSRQESWIAISFPRGCSSPGIEPGFPALQADLWATRVGKWESLQRPIYCSGGKHTSDGESRTLNQSSHTPKHKCHRTLIRNLYTDALPSVYPNCHVCHVLHRIMLPKFLPFINHCLPQDLLGWGASLLEHD